MDRKTEAETCRAEKRGLCDHRGGTPRRGGSGEEDISIQGGIFCPAYGSHLWTDHDPGTENPVGKLQSGREPEL